MKPRIRDFVIVFALATLILPALAQESPHFLPEWQVDDLVHDAIASGDWNGDGRLDVIGYSETEGAHLLTVYLQQLDGRLQKGVPHGLSLAGAERYLAAVRDLDGVNGADLIFLPLTGSFGTIEVVAQTVVGAPSNTVTSMGPSANWTDVIFADTDNSGSLDIISFNGDNYDTSPDGEIWKFEQQTPLLFSGTMIVNGIEPTWREAALFADINGDTYQDLITVGNNANTASEFYIRYGDATYSFATEATFDQRPLGTFPRAVSDVDGNGLTDIIFAHRYISIVYQDVASVFRDNDDDAFVNADSTNGLLAVGDFDKDGDLDVASKRGSSSNRLNLYLQESDGSFVGAPWHRFSSTSVEGRQMIAADLNSDGQVDFAGIDGGLQVVYSRNGSYPYADAALSVMPTYTEKVSGSQVDYAFTIRNDGPDTVDYGKLLVELSGAVEYVGTDGECNSYLDRSAYRVICSVADLGSGEQRVVNISSRALAYSRLPVSVDIAGTFLSQDEIDPNITNNSVDQSHEIRTGNDSEYDVIVDRLFVNEGFGQIAITASRSTTAINTGVRPIRLIHETTDLTDLALRVSTAIGWPRLKYGFARELIPLVTNDGIEGVETLTAIVESSANSPAAQPFPIVVSISDDRSDIISAGAHPFELWPTYIEKFQSLDHAFEPFRSAIGDVNGDSLPDLVVLTEEHVPSPRRYSFDVFLGTSQGDLADVPQSFIVAAEATDLAIGDFNGDGLNDVIVGTTGGLQVYAQNQLNNLQIDQWIPTNATLLVAVADLDGDGTDDVVSVADGRETRSRGDNLDIYMQSPAGALGLVHRTYVEQFGRTGLAIGDVDGNGLMDIAVTGAGTDLSVIFQDSNGAFAVPVERRLGGPLDIFPPAGTTVDDVDVADLNNDGRAEVLIEDAVLHFSGGMLSESVRRMGLELQKDNDYVDVNADGLLDVFTWYQQSAFPKLLVQQPDSSFEITYPNDSFVVLPGTSTARSVGDFGLDGNIEVAVSNSREKQTVIAYPFPLQSDLVLTTILDPATITAGDTGSLAVRLTNRSNRTSQETTIQLMASSHIALTEFLPAAGVCGIHRNSDVLATCLIPILDPSGFVDFSVAYVGTSAGMANVSIGILVPDKDIDPADNTIAFDFEVEAAPVPPPPPPPPPSSGGKGGGSVSPLALMASLLLIAAFYRAPGRPRSSKES